MASGAPPPSSRRSTPSRRGRSASAAAKSTSPSHNHTISAHIDNASDEPAATVFSSLSIAVEGTAPINKSNAERPNASGSSSSYAGGEMRRAPRKSKTDALAALTTRSRSPSFEIEERRPSRPVTAPQPVNGDPIPISPILNLDSVKTSSPRNPPKPTTTRPFDLEDCPTFYPSPEEFKDPLGYIRSITPQAKNYGIAKIVPPIGWNMPFVTDTEVSYFAFLTKIISLISH